MQLRYIIYGLKHSKRALDFEIKERRLAKLLCYSMDDVKFYLKELDKIQPIKTLGIQYINTPLFYRGET